MSAGRISAAVVAFASLLSGGMRARVAESTTDASPAACAAPAYREFDFFVGDWDTYDVTAPNAIVARNHVTRMLDGCAIREVYTQNDGLVGESFSTYDAGRRVWHQSWVTNHGSLLLMDGGLVRGRMTFTANDHAADGSASLVRVAWWRDGTAVREQAERSRDGGKSWAPMFDIVFRPHRPS